MNRKYLCPCGKQPKFGYINEKPVCCSSCKTDKMVDIYRTRKNIKCICGKKPYYGIKNTSATHCENCKTENMGLFKTGYCFCGKQANFGFEGQKPVSCAKCKTENMINLKYKKLKEVLSCRENSINSDCPELTKIAS